MASITIRKLPEQTKERLRLRAAKSGLSLEAYTRQVLQKASYEEDSNQTNLVDLARSCFGPEKGFDLSLPVRGEVRPPVDFS